MSREIKQGQPANVMLFLASSADHVTGKTGAILTVTLSKDGGAFAGIAPVVTERDSGWYNVALVGANSDILGDLIVRATAPGADPAERLLVVYTTKDANTLKVGGTDQTGGDLAALIALLATEANLNAVGALVADTATADALALVAAAVGTKASQASIDAIAAAIPDLATEANLNAVGALVADAATAAALALVAEALATKASQASVDGKASQASVDGITATLPDLATEANVNAVGALVADTATAEDLAALAVVVQWLQDLARGETRRWYDKENDVTWLITRSPDTGEIMLKKELMTVNDKGVDVKLGPPLGNELLIEKADTIGV